MNQLVDAIDGADYNDVLRLVEQVDDLNALSNTEWVTPLIAACQDSNIRIVRCLLQKGVDVHCTTDTGETALMAAVQGSWQHKPRICLRIGKMLLDCGSEVNAADDFGVTPLMHAAEVGCQESVELLLRAGAKPEKRDHEGRTALMHAAQTGNSDGIEALLKAGVDRTLRDKKGLTALDHVPKRRWKIRELLKVTQ